MIRKTILFVFTVFLTVVSVSAQEKYPQKFMLYGGLSIPVGKFSSSASNEDWKADPDVTFGIQYKSRDFFGFLFNANYSSNSATIPNSSGNFKLVGNWESIFFVAGLKFETGYFFNKINITIAPVGGINISISSKVNILSLKLYESLTRSAMRMV